MNEEMEMAGNVVGKSGATTTIKARVFDENGNLLADLGTIVGKRTKEEGRATDEKLRMLKERREAHEAKGVENG